MKLPIRLGSKAIIIITALVTAGITIPATVSVMNFSFKGQIAILNRQIDRQDKKLDAMYEMGRYQIQNTMTVKKPKKGSQLVMVPDNEMEITQFTAKVDSLVLSGDAGSVNYTIKPQKTFWERIKFWK